eukprot:517934_1
MLLRNVWIEGERSKPKASELYETVVDKYERKEGTNIFYFPNGHKYYGYAIEFEYNPCKCSTLEQIIYTVFKRYKCDKCEQRFTNEMDKNQHENTHTINTNGFTHKTMMVGISCGVGAVFALKYLPT